MSKLLLCLSAAICLLTSPAFCDNSLTLYFYPSPVGVNWESPNYLIRSVLRNSLYRTTYSPSYRYFIGHVSVDVACTMTNGKKAIFATGMHNRDKGEFLEYSNLLLRQNRGLDLIFHTFPGRLQTTEELREELDLQFRKGNLSFVTFLISPSSCDRVVQYFEEYKALGYSQYYGLNNRPLYREGGGCSAFGASFLMAAGIYDDEINEEWTNTIRVPQTLIGNKDNPVSIVTLLKSNLAKRWATEEEPHRKLVLWDPDKMHNWVVKSWANEAQKRKGLYTLFKKGRILGLTQDRSKWPTPTGDLWLAPPPSPPESSDPIAETRPQRVERSGLFR